MRSKRHIRRAGPSIQVGDLVKMRKSVGILAQDEIGEVVETYKPGKDRFLNVKVMHDGHEQVQSGVSVKEVRKL